MITAHLPAGYLAGCTLDRTRTGTVFWCAMAGALAPDLDMLWFHFIDKGQVHHHLYPTHWPIFWLALCLPVSAFAAAGHRPYLAKATLAMLGGALLHLALDGIAAPLYWAMPFDRTSMELIVVPSRHAHWLVSFVLHWTFGLELTIWLAAVLLFVRRRQRQTARHDAGPF